MGRPLEDVVSEQLSLLYDVYLEHYPRRALSWFWSHLNEMQCFDFDLADVKLRHFFTAHSLDFLGQQPVLKVILLQSAFVAFCTVIYALFNNRPRRAPELPDSPRLRAPLNALLNFLTPTTSIWPEFYLHIAQCGLINRSAQLNIPLMQLLRELLHGDTELRYPTADLPSFISNTHSSDGWRIKPSVEIYWHVYVAFQIIRLRLSRLSPLVSIHILRPNICGIYAKCEGISHVVQPFHLHFEYLIPALQPLCRSAGSRIDATITITMLPLQYVLSLLVWRRSCWMPFHTPICRLIFAPFNTLCLWDPLLCSVFLPTAMHRRSLVQPTCKQPFRSLLASTSPRKTHRLPGSRRLHAAPRLLWNRHLC